MQLTLEPVATPMGPMWLCTDEHARVHALQWDEQRVRSHVAKRYGSALTTGGHAATRDVRRAIEAYFAGELGALAVIETCTLGTAFQTEVWRSLRAIAPGTTRSYGQLAVHIGKPKAVRAVGMANALNPIGVIVPCHRVIGASGALTGFAGGMERKRWLLRHEGVL